ncbi:MAG: ABC transporter permease [Gemmataceae bacterium]
MWGVAFRAMLTDRTRLVLSLLGVAFSVVLVNLQAGLLLGLIQKASLLVDNGRADIWVGHRHMNNVDIGGFVQERWIHRLRGIEGVARAEPYIVMFAQAAMPDGSFENVIVVGCEPGSLLGGPWSLVAGERGSIVHHPDGIAIDACDAAKLGNCRLGDVREINGQRARVVAMTEGIVGFTTNPYVFTTLERARRFTGVKHAECSYFLVTAEPGIDVQELRARIAARVPDILDAHDRFSWSLLCMHYWLTRTGIGISFGLATLLGLLVGLGVVTQTLYASVMERLKEFATLKALGADDGCIAHFIIARALANAVLGSALGLLAVQVLGRLFSSPRAPILLSAWTALGSVLLISVICLLAAWLPYYRIRQLDPASVLRAS